MRTNHAEITQLDLRVLIKITRWLTPKDIAYLQITNAFLRSSLMRDDFWQNRFGVMNYAHFIETLSNLKDRDLIASFCNKFLSPEQTVKTQQLLNLHPWKRVPLIFSENQIKENIAYCRHLAGRTSKVIIALNEGLITRDELFDDEAHIKLLIEKDGLNELRKKRSHLKEKATINHPVGLFSSATTTPKNIKQSNDTLMKPMNP